MKVEVASLQKFFFEAARNTYAGDAKKETDPYLPKSKVYRFERGEYLYIDTYFTNGERSGGQTVIYQEGAPVWLMQYYGWCKNDDKDVLAFLKQALLFAYGKSEWHRGRGPHNFCGTGLRGTELAYSNVPIRPPYDQDFRFFHGRESIGLAKAPLTELFWHQYQGLLLAEPA